MSQSVATKPPIVDREFAEKFLWAVDRPLEFSVYQMIHEWWSGAPQDAIDDYATELAGLDGAADFLPERYLSEPLVLGELGECAPGTLGKAYHSFIVDHGLDANLLVNYKDFHARQDASGKLDRLPADMSYMSVRLSQIHDFAHTIAGFAPDPAGEIKMAAFHLAQLRYPYHSMRLAVTAAHVAFVRPRYMESMYDAMSVGWLMGRKAKNLHFSRWEDELDTPLVEIQADLGIDRTLDIAYGAD
ncbi:MAG: Coq4 family protein [Actinomycetota bacterium]